MYVVKGRMDAELLDVCSEPESAKDSNSFIEDSSTSISVDSNNVKDSHSSLDVSASEKVCYEEDETFVDKEYNPSYHFADLNALKSLEEHFLGIGSGTDHVYSGYANENIEESGDKGFEDILYSKGENPTTYVLSSGRWNVNQGINHSRQLLSKMIESC